MKKLLATLKQPKYRIPFLITGIILCGMEVIVSSIELYKLSKEEVKIHE